MPGTITVLGVEESPRYEDSRTYIITSLAGIACLPKGVIMRMLPDAIPECLGSIVDQEVRITKGAQGEEIGIDVMLHDRVHHTLTLMSPFEPR